MSSPANLFKLKALLIGPWIVLGAHPAFASATQTVLSRRIEAGQTLGRALALAGVSPGQAEAIVAALARVLDFRRCQIGDQLRIRFAEGEVQLVDYRQSAVDEWQVHREGSRYLAAKRPTEIDRRVETVELRIDSSLYEAALAAGEDARLPLALADVFAWDLDFYQDVRRGDRARVVVEKFFSKRRLTRYGEILAAVYQGQSVGRKRAFRYQLPNGEIAYFQEDGRATRKAFLKSPLKYANITSRFGSRFHPVLQYVRAHNGVDYGAPIGTPVWAVADGLVTRAASDESAGRHLCLRHFNSMESCYLHLSRFAAGVRAGVRVQQKQVIAFTGNTGLTTGPHLHFALKRGGHFINPLALKFPPAEPIPNSLREDFDQKVAPLLANLEGRPVAFSGVTGAYEE
ncbi:MAG TPA: M23 family metallopeptidase [Myxococcaceae bacterium]|nr:M23 family metallopeptidase [Myxococcaceae bacterium]